ncbi:MAG: TolC family protein [Bryobacterales bacterium]|nr:TolC family protein [Bryobacterales bacterium]MBV9401193.1 TolC family protein [Bryobacterales bacterium]
MNRILVTIAILSVISQAAEISVQEPPPRRLVGPLLRPFHIERRNVGPAQLTDSPRLEQLIRGGNLYLSVRDVIALALENNIDIAIQRYGPFLQQEVLRRAEGGAPLRNVGVNILPGPQSVSLAGVSVNAVGLSDTGAISSGAGIVTSIGTPPPSLDPNLFAGVSFAHQTTPLSVTALSLVPALITNTQAFQISYAQSFVTGTLAQLNFYGSHTSLNSPANVLNPFTQGTLELYVNQNLLQGWGAAVNNRYIRVAKNNLKVTDLQFQQQVVTTVSAVLNLYWDLVSFNDDVRIKQDALETAQKLFEDNQKQAELGTLPGIEVTRAAAQVSASKEDLLIAQTNVAQQEIVLKNALSRTGIASARMDEVHIVTLDTIMVPEKEDDLRPTPELVDYALAHRPEIEKTKINLESSKIGAIGTKNALLPNLSAFVDVSNNGLTGAANALNIIPGNVPDPAIVGGFGTLLGQIFQRHYPNYSAGFSLSIPFRNRAPQADYVADQLQLRQNELQLQRAMSQVRVEVRNVVIGLQQARARYETAVATRVLAEQTLEAEQNRFKFGESTPAAVIQAQRDLAGFQSSEVQAMANYTHAKIAFDQAIGRTLEVNGISVAEAQAGQVARPSAIPPAVQDGRTKQ